MNRLTFQLNIIIFATFLLVGCGVSKDEELRKYIASVQAKPASPIPPLPVFPVPEKVIYPSLENIRSPFKPTPEIPRIDKNAPNKQRTKQPLEAYPLDALHFVGVLEDQPIIWGLIRTPAKMIVRVKVGDYMGKNYGQIMRITRKSITLEETVHLGGKWQKRMVMIELRTPK